VSTLLDKYPRQLGLFVFGVLLLTCYMLALFFHLPTETLQGMLWGTGGGLIAELTGQRQQQHIDVGNIDRATVQTRGSE